jgi:chromosome segregation ATPase
LNIGGEMCKLYNNVQNEKDLMNAFTLFEKLFKYQKNLVETKKTLFQTYMLDREQINKNSTDALNRMRQTNEETEKKREAFVLAKATNLDEINKQFDSTIDEINAKIEKLKKEIDETLAEKKKFEDSLIKIKLSSTTVDSDYSKKTEVLNDLENKWAEIRKKERESIFKQATDMDENREANFSKCLEDLGKEGITIQEKEMKDFKIAFNNFSKNFHEYKLFREDIQKRSNDIKLEFEQLLENFSLLNSKIQNFRVISNPENLKNKIWELIVYNYKLQHPNDENLTDFQYLQRILLNKLDLRDEDNDQDVKDMKKALNLIKKNIGVNDLVSKLEGNSLKIETFVENIVDDIKERIKYTKKELKELQNNDNVIAEKIEKLEKNIENFENEIDDYKDNKRVINCILEALNGVRMNVKEKYLKTIVFEDLKRIIELIINNYIPNIDKMKIEYTKNSN